MRCFIAYPIPEAVRNSLWENLRRLRDQLDAAGTARISWVKPASMHITLAFLGDLEDEGVSKVARVLESPRLQRPVFSAGFEGIGQFPPRGRPRVLFTPILSGARECMKTESALRELLEGVWEGENRPFTPHITLGRVKYTSSGIRDVVQGNSPAGIFPVDKLVLFESVLKQSGAEYRAIKTIQY